MLVIGLVGEKRGGKGTFFELLKEKLPQKTIVQVRFSDIIGDILDILGKEKTRENMQKLPIGINKAFNDNATITKAMKNRVQNIQADIIILDGIRLPADKDLLREFRNNVLIYVTASPEIRYRRALAAAGKVGENSVSFEEFLRQDNAEIERQIPKIGLAADYIIVNEKTLDEYRWHINVIDTLIIKNVP